MENRLYFLEFCSLHTPSIHHVLRRCRKESRPLFSINFSPTIAGDCCRTSISLRILPTSAIRGLCNRWRLRKTCLSRRFSCSTKNPRILSKRVCAERYQRPNYALFHLLIQEASANWSRSDTRDYLARAFEHRTMSQACRWAENYAYSASVSPQVVSKLRSVARAFRELQQQRHIADYSNATKWDRIEASVKVNQCKSAFSDWKSIRKEYVAQRYLVSLLSNYKDG